MRPEGGVLQNNGVQLTKAARCAPAASRRRGQSLGAAFAADPGCSTGLWTRLVLALSIAIPACASHDAEAQGQLVSLYARISAGTTESDVEQWLGEPGYSRLRVNRSYAPFAVITPSEHGAKNWIICMDVDAKRVVRARVGTLDSCEERPEAAPGPKALGPGRVAL